MECRQNGADRRLYVSSARRKGLAACWTRRLHVSVSKNSRFAFRKPLHVSAGESACASSPNSYAPQLLDREALHSLSVNARALHAHNLRCIFFRRTTSHRKRIGPPLAGPAKLTRHLVTCAASGNLVVRYGRVKRNSGATAEKIFGDTIRFNRSLPLSRNSFLILSCEL